eukprot:scaffold112923_cov48-Phaeocystis_antarctica.AAC.2
MSKEQGPPRLGQSGAEQASPAPGDARGGTWVRPASANRPLGPRWPAISGTLSTHPNPNPNPHPN